MGEDVRESCACPEHRAWREERDARRAAYRARGTTELEAELCERRMADYTGAGASQRNVDALQDLRAVLAERASETKEKVMG